MALQLARSTYSKLLCFSRDHSFAKLIQGSTTTATHFSSATVIMGDEKPVETAIRTKLTEALKPQHLDVINESYMHNVPKGTESHFKVVIVASAFENVKRIEKHKLVHKALEEELDSSIHALSIVAKTPKEWEASQDVGKSPPCRGGAGL